jgi:hypothetical protein
MRIYLSTFPNEAIQATELREREYQNILSSFYFCREYNFKEYYENLSGGHFAKGASELS